MTNKNRRFDIRFRRRFGKLAAHVWSELEDVNRTLKQYIGSETSERYKLAKSRRPDLIKKLIMLTDGRILNHPTIHKAGKGGTLAV